MAAAPGGPGPSAPRPAAPPTPSLASLAGPGVRLLVWGRSDMGQLGTARAQGAFRPGSPAAGSDRDRGSSIPLPTSLEALSGKDVVGFAGSTFHAAFVTADGELYTAGCNDSGQLARRTATAGGGGGSSSCRPSRVAALESYNVVAAGCGAAHTVVLTEQGSVMAWGGNEFGQTGCGLEGHDLHHPRPMKGLGDQRVVRLAVGANHSLLLTASGAVFAVGQGSFGTLGLGDGVLENRATPVPVLPLVPLGVVQVAAGENHSAALTADGRVFTWGRGKYGQLGHGDWENRPRPVQVAALRGLMATQVACGGDHTMVLVKQVHQKSREAAASDGSGRAGSAGAAGTSGGGRSGGGGGGGVLYSFGRGTWGATGLGTTDNTCRPSRVCGVLETQNVVQVSAGARHSLVLTASHSVYAFGNNDFGQLGLGLPSRRGLLSGLGSLGDDGGGLGSVYPSPRLVATLPQLPVLAVVAAGDSSAALLQQDARPGELVLAGPHPGRRAGLYLTPYDIPDLMRLAVAAATASADPRVVREVVAAVEDVLSSPGYVLAAFRAAAPPASVPATATAAAAADGGIAAGGSGGRLPSRGSSTFLTGMGAKEASGGGAGAGKKGVAAAAAEPPPAHCMDVAAIQACFEALLRLYSPDVVAALGNSLLKLLDLMLLQATTAAATGTAAAPAAAGWQLGTSRPLTAAVAAAAGSAVHDPGRMSLLRLLFVVYQCPLLAGSGSGLGVGASLASRLVAVTVRLPGEAQQLLCDWLASLPPELLGGRVVRPLQHFLGHLAEGGGAALGGGPEQAAARGELMAAARVVGGLNAANERAGEKIPFTEFHNPKLSNAVNLKREYIVWLELAGGGKHPPLGAPSSPCPSSASPTQPVVSLCQIPCLLTPEAKSRILQGEALLQKEAQISASAREALMQGLHPASAVFLDIAVRRASILADTAQQLAGRPPHQLKRPLRVSFVSQGVAEEGLDQGGVSREFFQLLVVEIFQPQYGMFVYDEESRTFWFNASACLDDSGVGEFRLVGALLGLAIYNGVILDVHFPRAVYKKLLDEEVGLLDLVEAFPTLGRSLQAVLTMDPDQVESVLCRTFEVQYDYFGERRTVPLLPDGSSIPITGANRELYVRRLVEWTLHESVNEQFRAFANGFHQVCGGPALSLFRHEELELLVCGLPHLDFGALEAHARYEGGYHVQHPTIVMFWQVLAGLDLDQKRRFLAFTTGCDRAPVTGLGALVVTIQRSGPDSERLPTAHTCFNMLLLPEYGSRTKLRSKLLIAIENAQGFGLK